MGLEVQLLLNFMAAMACKLCGSHRPQHCGNIYASLFSWPFTKQSLELCVLGMVARGRCDCSAGVYNTSSTYNWIRVKQERNFLLQVNKKIAVEEKKMYTLWQVA